MAAHFNSPDLHFLYRGSALVLRVVFHDNDGQGIAARHAYRHGGSRQLDHDENPCTKS